MNNSLPYNLLFIITDHQRADSLGMVQGGREVTPNLNHLANQSATFTRAYTTTPLCVPARTALATGRYPSGNGVLTNDRSSRASPHLKTLHERLAEKGYEMAHIGIDHLVLEPSLRNRVAWDCWIDASDHNAYLGEQGIDPSTLDMEAFRKPVLENCEGVPTAKAYSSTRTALWPWESEHFLDLYWCDRAATFLTTPREKPFALFLNLWAPHPPLLVPEPFASNFDSGRIDLPGNVGKASSSEPGDLRKGIAAQLAEDVSPQEWRNVWAAHLGLVNLADAGIGRVLGTLREQGLWEKTLIIFTADHGDHLGQHALYQKMELYEPAVHVPLLIRSPQTIPSRIEKVVSHLDLFPTIMEVLGFGTNHLSDGQSLFPLLTDMGTGGQGDADYAFLQYSGNPMVGDIRRGVVSARYKYIWHTSGEEEFYDLRHDPLEMNNLAQQHPPDEIEEHRKALREWAFSHDDKLFKEVAQSAS